MIIVGIDIAKHNHQAVIIDERGTALCKPFAFANSNAGVKKLTDAIAQTATDPADVIVGMEATGHYWLALYSALLPLGFTLHVINPIQTDAMRHATTIRKSKTDVIDCELVAQTIRFGRFSVTRVADEDMIALRQLTRFHFSLVDSVSEVKLQGIALLDQVFQSISPCSPILSVKPPSNCCSPIPHPKTSSPWTPTRWPKSRPAVRVGGWVWPRPSKSKPLQKTPLASSSVKRPSLFRFVLSSNRFDWLNPRSICSTHRSRKSMLPSILNSTPSLVSAPFSPPPYSPKSAISPALAPILPNSSPTRVLILQSNNPAAIPALRTACPSAVLPTSAALSGSPPPSPTVSIPHSPLLPEKTLRREGSDDRHRRCRKKTHLRHLRHSPRQQALSLAFCSPIIPLTFHSWSVCFLPSEEPVT